MMRILLIGVAMTASWWASAQQVVSGTVKDAQGVGIPGVNVLVKGTSTGTTTDAKGEYRIPVTNGIVVFSFIGYHTQEVDVTGRSTVDITLMEDTTTLEEIVVVGYGTQKKKEITTAVVLVDETAIKDRPMISAAEALQGKAAGVQVIQPSGKPGGDISVRVRGATSVLAGNEPLYVVDGVPTTDIRGLNPGDIASMSVLKDASSSSIYGARAANGVVIITTKRGKTNEPIVRFSSYAGVSRLRKTVETLSTKQYRDLMSEIGIAVSPAATGYTDWSNLVFGTGTNQSYQMSVSGGTEKSQYMLSGNYLNNTGIVDPARFDRYSMRLNLDNQVKNWLKVSTNMNVLSAKTKNANDNTGSDRGGIILAVLNTPPFLNTYKTDGSGQFDPNPFQASWENPYANMYGPKQATIDNRLFGNLTAEAKVIEGLTYKVNFGLDAKNSSYDYYLDPFRTNYGRSQNGFAQTDKSTSTTWLLENTANYVKKWNDHNFSLLAGSSVQKNNYSESFIQGNDFPADISVRTLNAANNITASSNASEWALASFFGRLNYDFKGKYILSGTVRRDGSSKLAHHWGTMPSFSAGWRISSEEFMSGMTFFNEVKLRGGWGRNGNQEGIPNYARYGLTSYFRRPATSPLSGPGSTQITYGNPDLRWETTDQTNIGLDLSMWQARITVSVDAYLKQTNDVLLNVQLGSSVGDIKTIQTNAGSIQNKGIELNVSTVNTESDLKWNTDFNISFNRNKVTALQYTDVYFFGNFDNNFLPVSRVVTGLPLGSFYGYISDGVDPETGNIKYRDVNNNGIFDTRDRTVIGNAQPKFIFGITNSLSYKRFDLNVFFQGSYGNDIYNANRIALEGMFDSKNQSVDVLRRWTPTNKNTDIPKASGLGNFDNVRNSTRFVEDGSYIRLKAVTLTYNVNPAWLKRAGISKLGVYTTGQNLLTLTRYSGFDPEVNAFGQSATEVGIDYGTYPQSRTMTVGLNIEF